MHTPTTRTPPIHSNPPESTKPSDAYSICLATSLEQLRLHEAAWSDLARNAVEPNSFYEPWNFLPAFEAFAGPEVRVLFVFAPDGTMAGFFPLEARSLHPLLPLRVLESWRHIYGFLCTPLLRAGHAAQALGVLFDWFRDSRHGAAIWRLERASGDGPFAQALATFCQGRHRPTFLAEAHVRAMLEKNPSGPDAYLDAALSKKRAREVRRKGRALASKGKLEHRVLAPGEDAAPWLDDFLALEAAGWKGREGTAISSDPRHAAYFRTLVRDGHARGRVQMLGMYLDGKAIALKCNFVCPPGSFAFKIAFDESYHAQSPGVVLEYANLTRFHEMPEMAWMDSCAIPDHPMIDHLWTERRLIQNVWLATGRNLGDLAVALMPLGRWFKRALFPVRKTAPAPVPSSEEP